MSEDADALFLGMPRLYGRGGYQPILVFETSGLMKMMVPGTAESIDPRISTFLAGGFELWGGGELRFPLLQDWRIDVDADEDSFAVVDPHGFPAYSVALHEVTPEWLENLRRERQCIVITGTGLSLHLRTFTFDSISSSAGKGTVVGAAIPMHSERSIKALRDRLLRRRSG